MVFFPHFRCVIPIIEKLKKRSRWKTHDSFVTLFNEIFFNAIFGWTLGTGYYAKKPYFSAITQICGFEKNECYLLVCEPHGLLDHTSEWHVVDVTDPEKKIIWGKAPYAELEELQPTTMSLELLEKYSVLGKED
eukprot:g5282.t1